MKPMKPSLLCMRPVRRLFLLTCLVATSSLAAFPAIAADKPAQPKLVVVLVVDGLPQEQVTRYRDQFGQADSAVCWIREPGSIMRIRRTA
jgi:hypothetical protein